MKQRYSFWIESEQLKELRKVTERVGIRESEQIRRALADWLRKMKRRRT